MSDATFELLIGNTREKLRDLPDDHFHVVVTSPPYYQLRDYGTPPVEWDDGWVGELGQEPTPVMFVGHLIEVFEEVRRVLRPDGIFFVNIDDSYVGGGGGNYGAGLSNGVGGTHPTNVKNRRSFIEASGVKQKELALVPQRLVIALQECGWYVRNDNVWAPPNGMPESTTDRFTRMHEYVFMLTKGPSYFFDLEAVKEHAKDWTTGGPGVGIKTTEHYGASNGGNGGLSKLAQSYKDGEAPLLRHPRSVWPIPTESFPGAHFAVMAKKVAEKCIKAATSEKGCCAACGAPVTRLVERESIDRNDLPEDHPEWRPGRYDEGKAGDPQSPGEGQRYSVSRTLGWERSCLCEAETVPCRVLDPFGGAMTTAVMSKRLGRESVSVELSEEFAALGLNRMKTWWKDPPPQRKADIDQLALL